MIIAFVNAKGGVGKTNISVHATGWFDLHGCSVVLVDCDAQQLSSRWTQLANPNIEVVKMNNKDVIAERLSELAEQYDAVVVDAPGGLSEITVAILSVADAAIVPTSGGHLDVQGLGWTIKTIQAIQKQRSPYPLTVVLPVKASARHKTTRNLRNKARRLGFGVTRTVIPNLQIYAQAAGLESEDGESMEIPPSYIWNLGRRKEVRDAALVMDAAFQEMFPEACGDNPDLIYELVTPRNKLKNMKRGDNDKKVAANI